MSTGREFFYNFGIVNTVLFVLSFALAQASRDFEGLLPAAVMVVSLVFSIILTLASAFHVFAGEERLKVSIWPALICAVPLLVFGGGAVLKLSE